MNSHEDYEILVSSWIDGQLERPRQVEMLDHLARCESCRQFYLEARGLEGLMASVREPRAAEPPSPQVWDRIEFASRRRRARVPSWRRRVPAWAMQAAAVLVVAVGLGVVFWGGRANLAPRPADAEIVLGEATGQMTETRFVDLTKEVLRADRRYHAAMHEVMEHVLRDTTVREASGEVTPARLERIDTGETYRRDPA
jgi:predicted anti-sigma-YlaC factor YlaD